jgi:hypothetical protein
MPKKEEQMVDTKLTLVSQGGGSLVPYGLAFSSNSPMTKTEERMYLEKRKQQLVIEGQKEKTKQAMRCLSEIKQQASDVFNQDMRHHTAINEAAQGKPYQPLVEEFNDYAAKLEAQHLYRLLDGGAHQIGTEVMRSLYLPDVPEPLPPPPPTLWQKLLGG